MRFNKLYSEIALAWDGLSGPHPPCRVDLTCLSLQHHYSKPRVKPTGVSGKMTQITSMWDSHWHHNHLHCKVFMRWWSRSWWLALGRTYSHGKKDMCVAIMSWHRQRLLASTCWGSPMSLVANAKRKEGTPWAWTRPQMAGRTWNQPASQCTLQVCSQHHCKTICKTKQHHCKTILPFGESLASHTTPAFLFEMTLS